ncbi:MAG: ATP synthase subunit I [Betaproteobacteria bacterium]|nr:ATP synthase subunit I [Betaproteobacteria bacterium]
MYHRQVCKLSGANDARQNGLREGPYSEFGFGMNKARQSLRTSWGDIKAVSFAIKIQLALALVTAVVVWSVKSDAVRSVAYGLSVALLISMYLLRRMKKAQRSELDTKESLRQVRHTAVGRIVIAAVLLALPAFHTVRFLYGGVMTGFVLGQIGWLLSLTYVQIWATKKEQG